jgi:hypothetical protein
LKSDYRDGWFRSTESRTIPDKMTLVFTADCYICWRENPHFERIEQKTAIIEAAKKEALGYRYLVNGCKFRFNYGLGAFSQANKLTAKEGRELFAEVSGVAQEKFRIFVARMRRAPLSIQYEWSETEKTSVKVFRLSCELRTLFEIDYSGPWR